MFTIVSFAHSLYSLLKDSAQNNKNAGKRKLSGGDSPSKKWRTESWYHIPELAHIVAMCEEKIPFWVLGDEVQFLILTLLVKMLPEFIIL